VPQDGVGSIRRGMPAKLTLQDLPGHSFDGTVARYSNSLDLGTRTMLTEIDLKNPGHQLYPGMYANVTLELERHRDALKLPESAIGNSPDGKYVMIAQGGKLRRQDVTVGINTGKSVEIVHGLSGGETVVATLDPSIVPGELVNIVEQKAQPDERSNMVAKTQ
jgi:membrane fusion protein, multidrug efflux system